MEPKQKQIIAVAPPPTIHGWGSESVPQAQNQTTTQMNPNQQTTTYILDQAVPGQLVSVQEAACKCKDGLNSGDPRAMQDAIRIINELAKLVPNQTSLIPSTTTGLNYQPLPNSSQLTNCAVVPGGATLGKKNARPLAFGFTTGAGQNIVHLYTGNANLLQNSALMIQEMIDKALPGLGYAPLVNATSQIEAINAYLMGFSACPTLRIIAPDAATINAMVIIRGENNLTGSLDSQSLPLSTFRSPQDFQSAIVDIPIGLFPFANDAVVAISQPESVTVSQIFTF